MPDDFSAQYSQGRLGPGSRIAGYVIEEQVGAGGMAVVFRARDEVLGRLIALKVLSPTLIADQEFRTRFLRESRAIAAVDEPHIVPVYAAGEADGVLYIATRFVADGDLSSLLRRNSGPLEPSRAADLIVQVAAALDAAHQIGLVHRDVKPGNVLIETRPGRPEHAYLSDFGLTKAASGATGLTVTGMFLGTPDFCAPEQITGRPLDGRADQYALACVAFSLLTGAVPYHREETIATLFAHLNDPIPALTSRNSGLPGADPVMARALAKEPQTGSRPAASSPARCARPWSRRPRRRPRRRRLPHRLVTFRRRRTGSPAATRRLPTALPGTHRPPIPRRPRPLGGTSARQPLHPSRRSGPPRPRAPVF